jgi:hypothetical protein
MRKLIINTTTFTSYPNTTMQIKSSAFANNQKLPERYTCDGAKVNPPLTFEGIPSETKSLVLIFDDPDAPSGDFVHWLLWNIKPDTYSINEHSVPSGAVQGLNGYSRYAYGEPCPPSGSHHYTFKLYALDTVLSIPNSSTKADLLVAMEHHILAQASLIGIYR